MRKICTYTVGPGADISENLRKNQFLDQKNWTYKSYMLFYRDYEPDRASQSSMFHRKHFSWWKNGPKLEF